MPPKVQKWAIARLEKGAFTDSDYKSKKELPKQIKEFGNHLTERAAGDHKDHLMVPPLNSAVRIGDFTAGMKIEEFLQVLNSPLWLEILAAETTLENRWIEQNENLPKEKRIKHPSFKMKMHWSSWSAMLMLEYVYPVEMVSCRGFRTCLFHMIEHSLNKRFLRGQRLKSGLAFLNGTVTKKGILTLLDPIHKAMYNQHVIVRRWNASKTFREELFKTIKLSKWWSEVLGSKDDTMVEAEELLQGGALKKIPQAAVQEKKEQKERQTNALVKPIIVKEMWFVDGVRKLLRLVYGSDMNIHKLPKFTHFKDCAAALCLLQLLCGSRSLGVIGVNWFGRVNHTLDEEYRATTGLTRKEAAMNYSGINHCIIVKRITKEKPKKAREHKQKKILAAVKQVDVAEIELDDNNVSVNQSIIKPILFMLLDRRYLEEDKFTTDAALDAESAVDVFMTLVKQTREYVRADGKENDIGFVKSDGDMEPMWGYTDAEAYQQTAGETRAFGKKWNRRMTEIVKNIFPNFVGEGKGTHMLRRLYVNRGYYHFSSTTMKETAFTSLTLGHTNFDVSLYYTSLIFELGFAPVRGDLGDQLTKKMSDMAARLELLENEAMTVAPDPNKVHFIDAYGDDVWISRLPRAYPGESIGYHVDRGIRAVTELKKNDVRVTFTALTRLGVAKGDKKDFPVREMIMAKLKKLKKDVLASVK